VHDPLSVVDLVHNELRQRQESGYSVSGIEADLAATAADDRDRLEALYQELINSERRSDWAYQEPDSLEDILDAWPAGPARGSAVGRPSTVLGAAKLLSHFTEPLDDRIRSAIFGFDNSRISELARRTTAIAGEAG
jgi:hypothetical protein